ncbi:MAG: hypothetical protein MR531_02330 [Lachnospiraceae bacterium]|nr:hypothetical protein [Lachnospiraceae bacterium]
MKQGGIRIHLCVEIPRKIEVALVAESLLPIATSIILIHAPCYGKEREWSIGQIKTCREKQHVVIDDMKEISDSFCGKAAAGGNNNSTRDT